MEDRMLDREEFDDATRPDLGPAPVGGSADEIVALEPDFPG